MSTSGLHLHAHPGVCAPTCRQTSKLISIQSHNTHTHTVNTHANKHTHTRTTPTPYAPMQISIHTHTPYTHIQKIFFQLVQSLFLFVKQRYLHLSGKVALKIMFITAQEVAGEGRVSQQTQNLFRTNPTISQQRTNTPAMVQNQMFFGLFV